MCFSTFRLPVPSEATAPSNRTTACILRAAGRKKGHSAKSFEQSKAFSVLHFCDDLTVISRLSHAVCGHLEISLVAFGPFRRPGTYITCSKAGFVATAHTAYSRLLMRYPPASPTMSAVLIRNLRTTYGRSDMISPTDLRGRTTLLFEKDLIPSLNASLPSYGSLRPGGRSFGGILLMIGVSGDHAPRSPIQIHDFPIEFIMTSWSMTSRSLIPLISFTHYIHFFRSETC